MVFQPIGTWGSRFGRVFGAPVKGTGLYWDDEFTIAANAPLPNPMNADVMGSADISDSGNNMSKSNGKLIIAACAGANNPYISDHIIRPRTPGLAIIGEFTPSFTSERWGIGWAPSQVVTNFGGMLFRPGAVFDVLDNGVGMINATNSPYAAGTSYKCVTVQKSVGYDLYIKGGAIVDWIKLFCTIAGNAPVYPICIPTVATAQCGSMDYVRVRQLSAFFSQPNGTTLVDVTLPASGSLFTTVADAVHVMKINLSGSPAAGHTYVLEYRRQNALNKWILRLVRNGGNTNYDLQCRKVTNGVESTPGAWADITNVGNVDTFHVSTQGNSHIISTKVGATWTQQNNAINDAYLNTQVGLSDTFSAGSIGALQSGPRTNAEGYFKELDAA